MVCSLLAGNIPAHASPGAAPDVPGFTSDVATYTVSEYKYFLLSEYPTLLPLSEGELGLGAQGTYYSPMIPDGRWFL